LRQRRIGLGGDADPIEAVGRSDRAVGLDRDAEALGPSARQ
jgi:hypothetical protein